MSYRPKHLGHVNLYVRNAERSRQWYEDVLGLHTYHFRPGRAAFMSADEDKSHEVALMELGDDAPLQLKRQVGLNHAAFMMESLDDLKDACSVSHILRPHRSALFPGNEISDSHRPPQRSGS